eukprot:8067471-Karenia_brevis.AAC.1
MTDLESMGGGRTPYEVRFSTLQYDSTSRDEQGRSPPRSMSIYSLCGELVDTYVRPNGTTNMRSVLLERKRNVEEPRPRTKNNERPDKSLKQGLDQKAECKVVEHRQALHCEHSEISQRILTVVARPARHQSLR